MPYDFSDGKGRHLGAYLGGGCFVGILSSLIGYFLIRKVNKGVDSFIKSCSQASKVTGFALYATLFSGNGVMTFYSNYQTNVKKLGKTYRMREPEIWLQFRK